MDGPETPVFIEEFDDVLYRGQLPDTATSRYNRYQEKRAEIIMGKATCKEARLGELNKELLEQLIYVYFSAELTGLENTEA